MDDDNIQRFWQWFVKNEKAIKDCIENEQSAQQEFIVEQMNEQILGLGMLTWDIGLNDDNHWFLMLSPNGNQEMLEVSKSIMANSPGHLTWDFHSSRPAKEWNRQFTVFDSNLDEKLVDASNWEYVVFEEEEGRFDLIIEAKNLLFHDAEFIENAAEQFLIQEIGEEARILLISTVELVPLLDKEFISTKSSIAELNEHLAEMLEGED
jgi:hypothetical protein